MSKNHLLPWLIIGLLSVASVVQSAVMRFDKADYFVQPNEVLTIRLIFDADESMEGDQLPDQGFFSVGAAIRFPSGAAATHVDALQLPATLNSDGVGNPPLKEVTDIRAGAAGAVNGLLGGAPHNDVHVLTITLTNLAGSGSYTLQSELLLAPPFNNFISGAGQQLDNDVTDFGLATVHVLPGVPEPVISGLTAVPTNRWQLTFNDTNGVLAVYEIERTADLNTPIVWERVQPSSLLETSQGVYEAIFTDVAPRRYYRIKTLYPALP